MPGDIGSLLFSILFNLSNWLDQTFNKLPTFLWPCDTFIFIQIYSEQETSNYTHALYFEFGTLLDEPDSQQENRITKIRVRYKKKTFHF